LKLSVRAPDQQWRIFSTKEFSPPVNP
jgi:hypothetical protein